MKRLLLFCSFVLLLAVPESQALVIDAPHNKANDITCSSCHSYSLWWQYSPTTQNPAPNDHVAIVDALCMTCHNGAKSEPKAVTHSSAKIGSSLHGIWGVGCMACHDPHKQDQLFWADTPTKPYLITGSITGVSYDSASNRTTISYSGATVNAKWPAQGSSDTDLDWANKSFLNPDRGLILVHDSTEAISTFPIFSADSSLIVVRGELDASAIDPAYINPQTLAQNPSTCNTFGLIYGQLVKSTIDSKPVRFFDPNGGFVEEGPGTTGVCQVCHTDTSRFTSSGTYPTGDDSHTDRVTGNCSKCHMHRAGFKGIDPAYHVNSNFVWSGNCASCHDAAHAVANIVTETHGGNCGLCHIDPEGGGNRQDGDSANGTDGSAVGATKLSTCVECHITKLSLTSGGIHHQSAHEYAATGDCTQCHQDAVGKLAADHSATIATSVNCDSCHAQNVGSATGAPVDPAVPTIHDACTTCHESNGLLKAAYGAASAMPVGGGACEACHGVYFVRHDHGTTGGTVDHTVRFDPDTDRGQADFQPCSNCHSVLNWPNIFATHLANCATCHSSTRDINPVTPTGTTVAMVIANANHAEVNCLDCHQDQLHNPGDVPDHSANGLMIVLDTPFCVGCHPANNPLAVHFNRCSDCHTNPPNLQDPAYRPLVTTISRGARCVGCHTLYSFDSHTHDHSATVTGTTLCLNCHGGDVITSVHKGTCFSCHSSANGARIAGANGNGDATVNGGAGGSCDQCHTSYFTNHDHNHATQVKKNVASTPSTANCVGCHTATTTPFIGIGEVHSANGCASCHSAGNGALIGSAVTGGGECVTCHSGYFNTHDHGATGGAVDHTVQINPLTDVSQADLQPCSNCHQVLNWPNILTTHLASCGTCHTSSRDINPATPTGTTVEMVIANANQSVVNCLNCHQDKANGGVHPPGMDHLTLVLDTPFCVGCHPANAPLAVHNNQCSSCHTNPPVLQDPINRPLVVIIAPNLACTGCHGPDFFTGPHGHDHSATVTGTVDCLNCHSGDIITAVHKNSCFTCHSSVNGALIAGANGNGDATVNGGAGGSCDQCHTSYFTNHDHNHATQVKKNVASTPSTANCVGCHTATTTPFIGSGEVHSANGCASCHSVSNGALIGSAVAGGGECVTCHSGYFNGHDHGATGGAVDHTVQINPVTDVSQADLQPCSNCHQVLNWPSILTVHLASCDTCHTSSRDINPATPTGTTVEMVIANANHSVVNCLNCHQDKANGGVHPPGMDHLTLVLDTPFCVSCHLANNPLAVHNNLCSSCHTSPPFLQDPINRPLVEVIIPNTTCTGCHGSYFPRHTYDHTTKVSKNSVTSPVTANCAGCHTATVAPFIGAGDVHNAGGCFTCHNQSNRDLIPPAVAGGGECVSCHSTYFTGHGHTHDVLMRPTDLYNSSACNNCHRRGGPSSGNPLFTNAWSGSDGILALHQNSCDLCHTSTRTINVKAGYASVSEIIASGTNVGCLDCHADRVTHPDPHDFDWDGSCDSCHSRTNTILDVHNATCAVCHVNPVGGGPRRAGVDGNAINAVAGQTDTCLTCHPAAIYPAGTIHHDTPNAASFNCVACHIAAASHGGDHSARVSTSPTCDLSSCHPAASIAGTSNGIPVSPTDNKVHDACSTCHESSGALRPPYGKAPAMPVGGGTCEACHGSYNHPDYVHNMPPVALCLNCHSATTAPYVTSGEVHAGGCATCHNVVTGITIGSAAGQTNGANCQSCHSTYFNHHTHSHTMSAEAACTSCHSNATTPPYTAEAYVPELPPVHRNFCPTCHSPATGELIGSAFGKLAGATCQTCHGVFDNHAHNHDVLMRSWDLSSGSACNTCHRQGGTGSANPLFANVWSGSDGILALHRNSCDLCHASTRTTNLSPPYTSVNEVIMTGTDVGCLDCHATHPDPHNFIWAGNCITCHSGPDIMYDVHGAECALCHVNPAGAGERRVGTDGDATLAVSGPASCLTCHPNPSGGIHHDTPGAINNTCVVCHGLNLAKADHSTAVSGISPCIGCHLQTAGTTTGIPTDMTDGLVHDACRTCHTFDANLQGILVAPTGKRGVTAMPAGGPGTGDGGGPCTACHTASMISVHHATEHSLLGDCEYCHADPRNLAGGINFQETAPVGGIPNHLPCEECHVTPKTTNGWAGNQMTILAFNEGGTHSTTDYTTDFTRTTAHSGGHVIGNSVGRINNWGICFSCHDGMKSIRVNQFHAKPANITATNLSCGAGGTLAFAPGREARNSMAGFDFFASTFRPASTRPGGSGSCRQAAEWTGAVKYGTTDYPVTEVVVPDPWSTATNLMPMFPQQTPISPPPQWGDDVQILSATWNGTNIVATATNSDGCTALTAVYNGNNQAFSGSGACTATFGPGVVYNSSVPTLDVTTSNPSGLNVVGYSITNTAFASGHDLMTWEASCQTCHGTGSPSTAAPKGEIVPGVHSGNCGLCHQGGVGGAALIGSALNAAGAPTPYTCITCHIGYFDGHTHGTGSTHEVLMRATDLSGSAACNTCHRRGGTTSANPLFTNAWSGTDGISALHQLGCTECHNSTRTTNLGGSYTSINDVIMTGTTVACRDCHAAHSGHNPTDFEWDGTCATCHSGTDIIAEVHNGNCGTCHVNPSGGGARRAGTDGSALLGDASGLHSLATCLTCHPAVTYPTGGIHHDTTPAANNDCTTYCHTAANHTSLIQGTSPCVSCHTATAGTAGGAPVSLTDSKVHDACRSCHQFNTTTKAGELRVAYGRAQAMPAGTSATNDGGGACTNCHTATMASTHHTGNAHALIGECEYCHTDPRNLAGGTTFQETAPGGGIPTHLPCEECHVTPKLGSTYNGWTATSGQMTIYAFNEGGTHSTTDYATDFTRTTAHSGGHVIANTVGRINNWGICFSCHGGSTAVQVKLFHAKPTAITPTNLSCGTTGTSRYAPGREITNTIGNFDFFASTFRPASTRPGGSGSCRQAAEWSSAVKYGTTTYTATDTVVPDPWNTATGTQTQTIPMFPAQTPNTTTSPAADNVKVLTTTWNGTNIVVTATTTNATGCTTLTATYDGNNQAFSGSGTCTATFGTGVVYSPAVPTLDVTTSNPQGLGVTGYRISTP